MISLGFSKGLFQVLFRFGLRSIYDWFTVYLGLGEHLFEAGLGFMVYPGLVQDLSRVGVGPIQDWLKVCLSVV